MLWEHFTSALHIRLRKMEHPASSLVRLSVTPVSILFAVVSTWMPTWHLSPTLTRPLLCRIRVLMYLNNHHLGHTFKSKTHTFRSKIGILQSFMVSPRGVTNSQTQFIKQNEDIHESQENWLFITFPPDLISSLLNLFPHPGWVALFSKIFTFA